MRKRPERLSLLLAVVLLAVALTLAVSGGAAARSTFQSSPPQTVPATVTSTATAPFAPAAAPTAVPTLTPEAGEPGFLPAPTLTNPDDFLPGAGPRPQQAPLTGPAAEPPDEPAPAAPAGDVLDIATIIDSGVMALSYLWLCCGAAFILVAVLVFVWLMRRTRR